MSVHIYDSNLINIWLIMKEILALSQPTLAPTSPGLPYFFRWYVCWRNPEEKIKKQDCPTHCIFEWKFQFHGACTYPMSSQQARCCVYEHILARLTLGSARAEGSRYRRGNIDAAGAGAVPPNVFRVLGCFMQFCYIFIAYYMHVWSLHTNGSVWWIMNITNLRQS